MFSIGGGGPNVTLGRTGQGPASEFALTEGPPTVQMAHAYRSVGRNRMLTVRCADAGRLHAVTPPHELLSVGVIDVFGMGPLSSVPVVLDPRILASHRLFGRL